MHVHSFFQDVGLGPIQVLRQTQIVLLYHILYLPTIYIPIKKTRDGNS